MAGGMDLGSSGKGTKKPLDTQINLVPFIDLMAVTISFLIMTAVWTQIGRLQVSSSGQATGEATEEHDEKLEPITLLLTEKELRLTVGTVNYDPIQVSRNKDGQIELVKLEERLKEIKAQPGNDKQANITVQAEDAVKYEDLVRVIDECIGVGLPNVSVAAAMG
jgi:biopolymer transport protein ExbD